MVDSSGLAFDVALRQIIVRTFSTSERQEREVSKGLPATSPVVVSVRMISRIQQMTQETTDNEEIPVMGVPSLT